MPNVIPPLKQAARHVVVKQTLTPFARDAYQTAVTTGHTLPVSKFARDAYKTANALPDNFSPDHFSRLPASRFAQHAYKTSVTDAQVPALKAYAEQQTPETLQPVIQQPFQALTPVQKTQQIQYYRYLASQPAVGLALARTPEVSPPGIIRAGVREGNLFNTSQPYPQRIHEVTLAELLQTPLKQGGNTTCYAIAPLNALVYHPNGKALLRDIKIKSTPSGFAVKFPGQAEPIEVRHQELEGHQGVRTDSKAIQALERAVLKLMNSNGSSHQEVSELLPKVFGYDKVESILAHQSSGITRQGFVIQPHIADIELDRSELVEQLKHYFEGLKTSRQHGSAYKDVDIITAHEGKPDGSDPGNHYYTVDPFANTRTNGHITLRDPYGASRELSVEELVNRYAIEGGRIRLDVTSA
jgi:hypothetical protein